MDQYIEEKCKLWDLKEDLEKEKHWLVAKHSQLSPQGRFKCVLTSNIIAIYVLHVH